MSLTLRGIKGSALTHAELDNNFLWLGNRGTSNLTLNGDTLTITRGDDSYYTISLSGVGTTVTGLSYTGNTLTLFQSDGSSESVVISADSFVTGFTYNNANKLTISQNQGKQDINVFINQMSGLTINGTLNTNQIVLSGTNLTNILDNTVKKYSQTLTSPTAGRYTITHNLGTTDISVSLWLAFSNELTNAKVLNRLPNSVDVEFSVAPGEDVLVLIMGTTVNSSGVAYIYSAVTVGPNQIVYGDATGLITSNSTFVRNPISGNIGVGVTSPSAKLHINNTGTDNTVLFEDNTNPDSTPFVIDNNGNVGIGTSTPNKKLTVTTSNTGDGIMLRSSTNDLAALQVDPGIPSSPYKRGYIGLYNENSIYANVVFNTPYHTQSDYINTGLNLGIGHTFTTGIGATAKLHVVGSDSSSSNYGLKVQNSGGINNFVVRNDGNVGIGTSTPTEKLEVSGNTKLSSLSNVFKISSYTALGMSQGVGAANVFIGGGTVTDGANGGGISIGSSSTTYGDGVSIGQTAKADSSGGDAIAIGRSSTANGSVRSVAIGRNATSSASNAWALGYNATASQDNSFIFGNSSDVNIKSGFGTNTPEARIHIKGSDSSSSNYGLKVQNSGGTNSLVVRNDNQVMVNADNTPGDIRFYTKANGSTDFPLVVGHSGGGDILSVRGNGKINANTGGDYDVGFQIGNQFNETMPFRVKNYNNQALFAVFENGFTSTNGRANFGSNASSLPDSIVQIIGSDSSTGFGLKVKNSGGTDNFVVRNDGNVGIGTSTPTSQLDINGTNGYNQLRLRTSFTPTGSTDTRGNVGDIAWNDNNFYWKTSTQWLRVSGQTF